MPINRILVFYINFQVNGLKKEKSPLGRLTPALIGDKGKKRPCERTGCHAKTPICFAGSSPRFVYPLMI